MDEIKIHPLQAARKKLGIKQSVLADLTGLSTPTIKRAEGGEPLNAFSVSQICEYFSMRYNRKVEPQELGLHSQWESKEALANEPIQKQPTVEQTATSSIDTSLILLNNLLGNPQFLDKMQQAILQNLVSTTSKLLIQPPEASAFLEQVNTDLNEEHIAFLESVMLTHWNSYYTGRTDEVLHSLSIFLSKIEKLIKASPGTCWHKRILQLLALGYQLQNCILRDRFNYQQASISYQKAFNIAQELDNPELLASALARQGVALVQQHKSRQAILYLDNALNIIEDQGLPKLRGYILQALSEASAQDQRVQESWLYLDQAEEIIIGATQEQSFIRFNPKSIAAQKGIDAVFLKDFKGAIDLIDQSLKTYDPTGIKGRARLTALKAEAYYELDILDTCIESATEALTLAQSVGSNKIVARIEKLHANLEQSRWKQESTVAQLKTILYSTKERE